MRLIDELVSKPSNCSDCRRVQMKAAQEIGRLRSFLFQFLDNGDTPEMRVKVAQLLGVRMVLDEPTRITDDKMFSPLHDEN